MPEAVYFELNNWVPGEHYPNAEPFSTWMGDDCNLYFDKEDFVKENRLCVVMSIVDMSVNFCITAARDWVEKTCPELLTRYTKFLREQEPGDDGVYGDFGDKFLEYKEENIGITRV